MMRFLQSGNGNSFVLRPFCSRSLADIPTARHDASMIEILGMSYGVTVGSDIQCDGMYLEVEDNAKVALAEIFYSDGDNSMTFTGYRADLPLPLVEWQIAHAKERLTPASEDGS